MAAGQAGMALHTMAILSNQADVLKEMDEGSGITPEAVKELCKATDLALRATKHTARAIGCSMAGAIAAEHHLWLNLMEIHDKERFSSWTPQFLNLDCLGEVVNTVVDKFRAAKSQSAALRQFMPRRVRESSNPSPSQPRECSSHRPDFATRRSDSTHPQPATLWGASNIISV